MKRAQLLITGLLLAGINSSHAELAQQLISTNPSYNYRVIGEQASSTPVYIDNAVANARKMFPWWSRMTLEERINLLERLYTVFQQEGEKILALASQEMGVPIAIGRTIDLEAGLAYMRGYLDHAAQWLAPEVTFENNTERHTLFFEARGVAAVSVAWNYPFCNFIWGVIPNLIAGNTVVFKHSEECPLTGALLEKIITDADILPTGVLTIVHGTGEIGEYLMNSTIDLIHFTGSSRVGQHLYEVAARKFIPAILELGGSAAAIVFADASIDEAVDSIYANRFTNSGQICDGIKRLLVHRSCFDKVVARLHKIITSKSIGPADITTTDMGPLVAERQVVVLESQVADAIAQGAVIVCGGKRPAGLAGAYYEHTLITGVTSAMRIWKEEVFGPVLPIVPFDTFEEALHLANDTIYGLGGYIYTQDTGLALRASTLLRTGNVSINGADYVITQDPFGGCKKSGIGREHGRLGIRELCSMKLVAIKK